MSDDEMSEEEILRELENRQQINIHPEQIARVIYLFNTNINSPFYFILENDDIGEQLSDAFEQVRYEIYALGEDVVSRIDPEVLEKRDEIMEKKAKGIKLKKNEVKFYNTLHMYIEAYGLEELRKSAFEVEETKANEKQRAMSHAKILLWDTFRKNNLRNIKLNKFSLDKIREYYKDADKDTNSRALDQATTHLKTLRFLELVDELRAIHEDKNLTQGERFKLIKAILDELDSEDDDDDEDPLLPMPKPILQPK